MKKHRQSCAALGLALLLLTMTGCSLARPERGTEGTGDRFCGLYLVHAPDYDSLDFYHNPDLTEYGADTADLGELGTHAFPRMVLFADEDGTFPGLPGFPLYALELEKDYGRVSQIVSQMQGGHNAIKDTDEGIEITLEGTLYVGPPAGAGDDWDPNGAENGVWRTFHVYQTPDGRAYLNGYGDTSNGLLSPTVKVERTVTEGDKVKRESVSASVKMEQAPRLTAAAVLQYGADGELLSRTGLPVDYSSPGPTVKWLPEAAWCAVEELSADGARRTAYDKPAAGEEPVRHTLILLDEDGIGRGLELTME